MQTSRKKRILLVALVGLFFIIGVAGMKIFLTDSTSADLMKPYIKELKAENKNVDLLFIGGSRTNRGFDPDIFMDTLDDVDVAINNGTPAQRCKLSYYMLEYMLKDFHPKYVIYGASYNGLMFKQDVRSMGWAIDRMPFGYKIKMAIGQFGFNEGLMLLTGKAQYANELHFSRMKENFESKFGAPKESVTLGDRIYKRDGYKGTYTGLVPGNIPMEKEELYFDEADFEDEAVEYLDKIVQLCKDNDIKLYLVSGPCSLMNLYRVKNYQDAVDYYNKYAEENGIVYYNLNYLKNREELFSDDMFEDYLHTSYYGAQTASKMFAPILKESLEGKDVSKYFYKDMDELRKDVHRIVCCDCAMTHENGRYTIAARSYQNEGVTPEYRLLVTKDKESKEADRKYAPLTKWTTDNEFNFNENELKDYYNIKLEARCGQAGETYAFSVKRVK